MSGEHAFEDQRQFSSSKLCKHSSDMRNLVVVNGVAHSWINALRHRGSECAQYAIGLTNTIKGNVGVYRCSREIWGRPRSLRDSLDAFLPDRSDHRLILPRPHNGARALLRIRELGRLPVKIRVTQCDPPGSRPKRSGRANDRAWLVPTSRMVRFEQSEQEKRIGDTNFVQRPEEPNMRNPGKPEPRQNSAYHLASAPRPVHHHNGSLCTIQGRPGLSDARVSMRIGALGNCHDAREGMFIGGRCRSISVRRGSSHAGSLVQFPASQAAHRWRNRAGR